jgi:hypothetical protein
MHKHCTPETYKKVMFQAIYRRIAREHLPAHPSQTKLIRPLNRDHTEPRERRESVGFLPRIATTASATGVPLTLASVFPIVARLGFPARLARAVSPSNHAWP